MRSLCPIPFESITGNWKRSIKYKGKPIYPIFIECKGIEYSSMCFDLKFLNEHKRYLVNRIYYNVEFRDKGSRFCYA